LPPAPAPRASDKSLGARANCAPNDQARLKRNRVQWALLAKGCPFGRHKFLLGLQLDSIGHLLRHQQKWAAFLCCKLSAADCPLETARCSLCATVASSLPQPRGAHANGLHLGPVHPLQSGAKVEPKVERKEGTNGGKFERIAQRLMQMRRSQFQCKCKSGSKWTRFANGNGNHICT